MITFQTKSMFFQRVHFHIYSISKCKVLYEENSSKHDAADKMVALKILAALDIETDFIALHDEITQEFYRVYDYFQSNYYTRLYVAKIRDGEVDYAKYHLLIVLRM